MIPDFIFWFWDCISNIFDSSLLDIIIFLVSLEFTVKKVWSAFLSS